MLSCFNKATSHLSFILQGTCAVMWIKHEIVCSRHSIIKANDIYWGEINNQGKQGLLLGGGGFRGSCCEAGACFTEWRVKWEWGTQLTEPRLIKKLSWFQVSLLIAKEINNFGFAQQVPFISCLKLQNPRREQVETLAAGEGKGMNNQDSGSS